MLWHSKYPFIGLYQHIIAWNRVRRHSGGLGLLYPGIACAGEVIGGRIRVMACWRSGWWLTTGLLVSYTSIAQNLKLIVRARAHGSRQGHPREKGIWLLTAALKGRGSWGQGRYKCHSHFQEGQKGGSQVASPQSWKGGGADLPVWPVAWTRGVLWMLYTLTLARLLVQSLIASLKPS